VSNQRIEDDVELEEELALLREFAKEHGVKGPFLKEQLVADYFNIPVTTLQVARSAGRTDFADLDYYKFGANVKYHVRHVARHAVSRRHARLAAAE
jgi:hypothetical protein